MKTGSLFNRPPAPLIGLDVSTSSVKLVELGQDRSGNLTLERCGIELLESGWVSDGNIEKFDEVAEAMRRVVRRSGSKTKNVALALPGAAVITKKISLPASLKDAELEMQVEAEATQYIPFPLAEVSLDFCVLGPSANSSEFVDILLAASRKEKVSDRQGLAEAAGLNPVIMDVESYASRQAASRVIESLPNRGRPPIAKETSPSSIRVGRFCGNSTPCRPGPRIQGRIYWAAKWWRIGPVFASASAPAPA